MKRVRHSWKKWSWGCAHYEVCDCQKTTMCWNDDNETGECDKEDCPTWPKRREIIELK